MAVVTPMLALSVGWGIRGQYGGQRGAMVAGALVGLALAWVFGHPAPLVVAGVAAAVGLSVGWGLRGQPVAHWLLFVLWYQTLSTVLWAGLRASLRPDDAAVRTVGRLRACFSGWGSALPVEAAFVAVACVLTGIVLS
jgi:hypothetical protein